MQQDIKYFIIGQLVEQNTLMGIELQKVAAEKAKAAADEAEAKVAEAAKSLKVDPVDKRLRTNHPGH